MQNSRKKVKNAPQTESKALSERGMNLITSRAFRRTTAPFLNNKDFCRFFFGVSKKVSDCEGNKWIKDERERRRKKKYEEDLFYSSLNMVEIDCGILAFNYRGSYWISKSPDSNEIIMKPFEFIKEPLKAAFVVSSYENRRGYQRLACLTYSGKVFIVNPTTRYSIKLNLPPALQISLQSQNSIFILTKEKGIFRYELIGGLTTEEFTFFPMDPKVGEVIQLVNCNGAGANTTFMTRYGIYMHNFPDDPLLPLSGVQEVFSDYGGAKHFHMLNGDVLYAKSLSKQPTKIENLPPVKKLFSRGTYMIAVTVDGQAFGWGDNSFRQLGSADRTLKQPQEIEGLQGHVIHTCTLQTSVFIFTRSEKGLHTYVLGFMPSFLINYQGLLLTREDIPTTPCELMLPAELVAPPSEEEMKAFLAHYTPKEVLPYEPADSERKGPCQRCSVM